MCEREREREREGASGGDIGFIINAKALRRTGGKRLVFEYGHPNVTLPLLDVLDLASIEVLFGCCRAVAGTRILKRGGRPDPGALVGAAFPGTVPAGRENAEVVAACGAQKVMTKR